MTHLGHGFEQPEPLFGWQAPARLNVSGSQQHISSFRPGRLTLGQHHRVAFFGRPESPDRLRAKRLGYFCRDRDSTANHLVFNRTVGLRDTWAKVSGAKVTEAKVSVAKAPIA